MTLNSPIPLNPILNGILQFVQKHEIKGKYFLYQYFQKSKQKRLLKYKINDRPFYVPLDEWCFWLEYGPENYYLDEMIPFCNVINSLESDFTFFDLGADIGVVSSIIDTHCPRLKQVIAAEPNPGSFQILDKNLSSFAGETLYFNCAISNFSGFVDFSASEDKSIDHEGHIDPSKPGSTEVISLDELKKRENIDLQKTIVLKIDVEGQEAQAIQGATQIISGAANVIILLEIHPDVLQDTSVTPEDLFSEAEKIRDFRWLVPKHDNRELDRNGVFFDQFSKQQYDVIGISQ